jgi:hypothetical protein
LETKKTMNIQGNIEQKEQFWCITIPNYKIYYRATAVKIASYWHKNRYEDKRNRIEDPDMNPHSYTHIIFEKCAKNI